MKTVLIFVLIFVGAASASAQKVKVGADPHVDVSKYKTYTWDKGAAAVNPMINQMIIEAVDQTLTARGLKKTDTKPDITIVAWAVVGSNVHVSFPSSSNAMGSAPSTGIAVGTQSWTVSNGTLVVDIVDAGTKNSVWRGAATAALPHGPTLDPAKDAKDASKHITKAVEKMFKQFPTPSKN